MIKIDEPLEQANFEGRIHFTDNGDEREKEAKRRAKQTNGCLKLIIICCCVSDDSSSRISPA